MKTAKNFAAETECYVENDAFSNYPLLSLSERPALSVTAPEIFYYVKELLISTEKSRGSNK